MAFGGALAVSDRRYRLKVRKQSEVMIDKKDVGNVPLVTETRKA